MIEYAVINSKNNVHGIEHNAREPWVVVKIEDSVWTLLSRHGKSRYADARRTFLANEN